jgi:hypothetical protein
MPAPSPDSASARAAVLHVLERCQGPDDRLVASAAVEPRDERDTARVVLERGVIEPLRLHRLRPPPGSWLVRRYEERGEPASRVEGAKT